MQERHQNRKIYFQEQALTTKKHVIPYIEKSLPVTNQLKILEIGCGEGGNMLPFLDIGCSVVGIDLSANKIKLAEEFFRTHPNRKNLQLLTEDIYKADYLQETFDLIILRDVIEHIPEQQVFMQFIRGFLKPGGKIFFGFPPWQNPFGGHQQIIKHRFLSKLPYFHLLPESFYRFILNKGGVKDESIGALIDVKKTGISIERFEKIIKKENYSIDQRTLFLINPNYETKFKIRPRVQFGMISAIPWLRNFLTTAAYYLISPGK